MPELPEALFVEAIERLVRLDSAWIPEGEGSSLYLRPFMIATEAFLGVRPAKQYRDAAPFERAALHDLAATLRALPPGATPEAIQDEVYAVGKRHPFPALKAWFDCLYQVLLGQQEGPRFGGFVALYGITETTTLIEARTRADAA